MDERRPFNRRQFERFALPAMYTAVEAIRTSQPDAQPLTGHAYDVSEGGARVELDEALSKGETVHLRLNLPAQVAEIEANASVVWVNAEDDDPGPRRMALLGLVGGPMLILSFVLVLYGVYPNGSAPAFLLALPEILWEASLGIYTAWKGFRAPVEAA